MARMSISGIIIVGLFTLFAAVGGYAFNAIDVRMANSEARIIVLEQVSIQKQIKIAALESEKNDIKQSLANIQDTLNYLVRLHMKESVR